MSKTQRFPFLRELPDVGAREASLIITILPATTGPLQLGGEQAYVSVAAWRTVGEQNTETPYNCVALEFSANTAGIVGNGTDELIGLFGQINLVKAPANNGQRKRTLLAILGIGLGNARPQIPLVQQIAAASDQVGFTQLVSNIGVYDQLSIGGVLDTVALPENLTLTVVARPIRERDYLG